MGRGKHSIKKKNFKIVTILMIVVLLAAGGYLGYYFYTKNLEEAALKDIQEYTPVVEKEEQTPEEPVKTETMLKVAELKEENSDIRGWIRIDGTNINYPILQTTDNDYYLTHDYKKANSRYGSIYLKDKSDIDNVNSNVIIYGHNIRGDKVMFNNLLKYMDKSFYEEHKIINITTATEERVYEIVSVFKSRVFYTYETDVFRYYNVLNFASETEYYNYLGNAKRIQLYSTGVTATYGQQLITLITCEDSHENGRLVVIAKRVS